MAQSSDAGPTDATTAATASDPLPVVDPNSGIYIFTAATGPCVTIETPEAVTEDTYGSWAFVLGSGCSGNITVTFTEFNEVSGTANCSDGGARLGLAKFNGIFWKRKLQEQFCFGEAPEPNPVSLSGHYFAWIRFKMSPSTPQGTGFEATVCATQCDNAP